MKKKKKSDRSHSYPIVLSLFNSQPIQAKLSVEQNLFIVSYNLNVCICIECIVPKWIKVIFNVYLFFASMFRFYSFGYCFWCLQMLLTFVSCPFYRLYRVFFPFFLSSLSRSMSKRFLFLNCLFLLWKKNKTLQSRLLHREMSSQIVFIIYFMHIYIYI